MGKTLTLCSKTREHNYTIYHNYIPMKILAFLTVGTFTGGHLKSESENATGL